MSWEVAHSLVLWALPVSTVPGAPCLNEGQEDRTGRASLGPSHYPSCAWKPRDELTLEETPIVREYNRKTFLKIINIFEV